VDKARKKRIGQKWLFPGNLTAENTDVPANDRRIITFEKPLDENWFEQYGHIPLPPYMKREDKKEDSERYQTVYAKNTGSAAAPTAGLHFTPGILKSLEKKGIQIGWVTLNVGLGTFAPVRTENIEDHSMHTERYNVPVKTAELVNKARKDGRNIIAVGTTSLRTLESAWDTETGKLRNGDGATDIFIYPGYKFKVVNQLFTNFHTPESTLLMLVSAFSGRDKIINAYKTAVQMHYRFFSYGDAMFIK
jgi:S-adenosylmethionine:tRNA ribosyltransferase-isomerase